MADFSLDSIIKLPNQQKVLILVVIIVAVAGSYFWFIHRSYQETLSARQDELSRLQAKYDEQQKVLAQLPKFERELKDLQVQFEESLKLLPNTREIPSLLSNIATLARNAGLSIDLFEPKSEEIQDFYAEIPVAMAVRGSYHNVGYFFDSVSKLERIVNISNMEMNSKKKEKGSRAGALQAKFQAVTFKFVEKDKTGDKKKRRKRRR